MAQKLLRIGVGAVTSLFAPAALASSSNGGYVYDLSVAKDGNIWFAYSGTHNGDWPSCAEANGLWVVNGNTPAGQNLLATLMTAAAGHIKIDIQGTGACVGNHEEVAYVVVKTAA